MADAVEDDLLPGLILKVHFKVTEVVISRLLYTNVNIIMIFFELMLSTVLSFRSTVLFQIRFCAQARFPIYCSFPDTSISSILLPVSLSCIIHWDAL